MTQKSTSFNDVVIVTVVKNDYSIHFWGMNKSEAVNRMKNPDLIEKSGDDYVKKIFIIMMTNNMPETMNKHQRY